jgi:hypothetical protein
MARLGLMARALVAVGALMMGVGLTAVPASAESILFTVRNPNTNGSYSATAGTTTLTNTTSGARTVCTSSTLTGTIPSATGVPEGDVNTIIGRATSASFVNCTGPDGATIVTMTEATTVPLGGWPFVPKTYDGATDQTTMQFAWVQIHVSSRHCRYDAIGAPAGGGTYSNATSTWAFHGSLTVAHANCAAGAGAVDNQTLTYSATYKFTPAVTIRAQS